LYEIVFYQDGRGSMPVQEFLDRLNVKSRQKALRGLEFLEMEGPALRRPYADKVRGKIYELRVRFSDDQVRIFYFFVDRNKIVLLHAIRKKTNAVPDRELVLAETRMMDHLLQDKRGEV